MTGDDWIMLGKVLGAIVVGGYFAVKLHLAEQQAKKAKEFAEPTGNGFAKNVKDALADLQEKAADQATATTRIEEAQARDAGMLYDHIRAHANADVLKGARNDSPSGPYPS